MANNAGVIAFLFLLAVLQSSSCSKQYAQKLCRTEEDCDWDQCCVEAQTRLPGFNGICKNPSLEGQYCEPRIDKNEEGRYKETCPCSDGLSCQLREIAFGDRTKHLHVCQS